MLIYSNRTDNKAKIWLLLNRTTSKYLNFFLFLFFIKSKLKYKIRQKTKNTSDFLLWVSEYLILWLLYWHSESDYLNFITEKYSKILKNYCPWKDAYKPIFWFLIFTLNSQYYLKKNYKHKMKNVRFKLDENFRLTTLFVGW